MWPQQRRERDVEATTHTRGPGSGGWFCFCTGGSPGIPPRLHRLSHQSAVGARQWSLLWTRRARSCNRDYISLPIANLPLQCFIYFVVMYSVGVCALYCLKSWVIQAKINGNITTLIFTNLRWDEQKSESLSRRPKYFGRWLNYK
jgi:hypothetical protein